MGLRSWRSEKFVTRSERHRLKSQNTSHREACRGFNRAVRHFRRKEAAAEAGRYHYDLRYDEAMGLLEDAEIAEREAELSVDAKEASARHFDARRDHINDRY